MTLVEMLKTAVADILKLGPSVNAASRKEIIDVVGNLADELDRALAAGESYLTGARYSIDDAELIRYLDNAESTLMRSFMEHHVCAGLYHLADRMTQIFDPLKLCIDVRHYGEVINLIDRLRNGERSILDDLDALVADMRNHSNQLGVASSPAQVASVKSSIDQSIAYYKEKLAAKRRKLKSIRRALTDKL